MTAARGNEPLKLGIIGLGNMGNLHCRLLENIPTIELGAICDADGTRLDKAAKRYGVAAFDAPEALLEAKACEAVLVATPHYSHTPIGIAALKAGYHVLMEKPISVHKADAERLLRAHRAPTQVFAAMFNQRTNPAYRKIRSMIERGELGEIRRIQWTITDWFRSQAYYDSGGWRATWGGEGGGVLLNQCPHQLDLWQWLFGMPATVRAFVHLGKHHHIEVEDEVTAYLEYPNGATGVFTTTTGEAPGTNRLEVAGDRGLLVYDANDRHMTFTRNAKTVTQAIAENRGFEKPEAETVKLRVGDGGRQHAEILENFAAAVRGREDLIAPAAEGIHSVELANAMLLSGWLGQPVALPMSARRYAAQLKKRVEGSRFNKVVRETVEDDMSSSF